MSSVKWRPFCLGLNVLICSDQSTKTKLHITILYFIWIWIYGEIMFYSQNQEHPLTKCNVLVVVSGIDKLSVTFHQCMHVYIVFRNNDACDRCW